MSKLLLFLLLLNINLFACTTAVVIVPIIDASVKINAKKSNTSFNITWKFKKDFIASLAPYDKNKNGKFDKDEQKEIENNFISYVKANNYLTDIIYIKKDQKIRKSQKRKLNITDSGLIFSDDEIKYYFNCNVDFTLEEDHRLYIRFFDTKSNINIALKDISLNNYNGVKVIKPQDIRANIYFYNYIAKTNVKTDIDTCNLETHKHDKIKTLTLNSHEMIK